MRQSISRDEFNRCMGFINILKDYEQIGDIVEKNIIYLAESKYANNIHFSEEGQKELSMMADKIKQMIHVVNAALV
ncbi:MAG: Na/Pi cotransporter family protein, partial [Desulfotomaculum sp.]|nr:Na/Pi cotransporter family protein [Desulfotomaculum sp.]